MVSLTKEVKKQMTISGGRILSVEANRLEDVTLESMSVNIGFEDLRTEGETLILKYSYAINYAPKFAEITVRGELVASEDEKTRKAIKDEWDKRKQLPPSFAEDALTAITYAASAVGTLAAFGLNIPAPLNVPRARLGGPQVTPATSAPQTPSGGGSGTTGMPSRPSGGAGLGGKTKAA